MKELSLDTCDRLYATRTLIFIGTDGESRLHTLSRHAFSRRFTSQLVNLKGVTNVRVDAAFSPVYEAAFGVGTRQFSRVGVNPIKINLDARPIHHHNASGSRISVLAAPCPGRQQQQKEEKGKEAVHESSFFFFQATAYLSFIDMDRR
jgi:hypothetical protein